MTAEDKEQLIKLLTDSHSTTQAALEGLDPECPIHGDTGWRIRDIIGHIATWDHQVTKSLLAFQAGTEYVIPDLDEDESEFNAMAVIEQGKLSTQEVFAAWEKARQDFIEALLATPPESFPGDLVYPWGDERGDIAQLVQFMVDHETEHREEIMKAVGATGEV